jgi:hypothetical protein
MAKDCNCNKPAPLGRPTPGTPPKSLVASGGGSGLVYVAPDGTRTAGLDLLGARAAVIRGGGGHIEG